VQLQPSYDTFARDKQDLRSWAELSNLERQEDEFAEALLGPLAVTERGEVRTFHYNLEAQEQVWEQVMDQRVLTLQELAGLVRKTKVAVQTMIKKSEGGAAGTAGSAAGGAGEDEDGTDEEEEEEEDLEDSDGSEEGTGKATAAASRLDKRAGDSLPWKIIRRMTKVLALCWTALGIELIIHHQVIPPSRGDAGRRLKRRGAPPPAAAKALAEWDALEELQVVWPHRGFFQPAMVSCLNRSASEGGLLVGTQYRLYSSTFTSSPIRLSRLPRSSFPPHAVALCPSVRDSESRPESSACLLGALVHDGVAVWPFGSDPLGEQAVVLPVYGRPWRSFTGATVPCAEAAALMTRLPESDWCLLLAGWNGEHVLVAAAPLPAGPTSVPSKVRLAPRLDVPLMHPSMQTPHATGEAAGTHLAALHLDAQQGHLWVLYSTGSLEAWDLHKFRGMGPWQLRWRQVGGFHATGLCTESRDSLLLVGTDDEVGPRMFRIQGLVRSSLQDSDAGSNVSKAVLPKSGSNGARL